MLANFTDVHQIWNISISNDIIHDGLKYFIDGGGSYLKFQIRAL